MSTVSGQVVYKEYIGVEGSSTKVVGHFDRFGLFLVSIGWHCGMSRVGLREQEEEEEEEGARISSDAIGSVQSCASVSRLPIYCLARVTAFGEDRALCTALGYGSRVVA